MAAFSLLFTTRVVMGITNTFVHSPKYVHTTRVPSPSGENSHVPVAFFSMMLSGGFN